METKESGQKMTISDVAEALNISKTTVSRAISGREGSVPRQGGEFSSI